MIRQPFGVWETGGALYEVEEKAFLPSSIKRQRVDWRPLDFLLSNSVERTFCFMCILTLYSTLESALILICLQSVRVEIGLPEVHSATFGM